LTALAGPPSVLDTFRVATAMVEDAGELAVIDHEARVRRQNWGDPRFDPAPVGVGGELVRMIADGIALDEAQRTSEPGRIREELMARDVRGNALAAGYLVASPLGPPFAPVMRAEIARLAADPENPRAIAAAHALVASAWQRVSALGARELLVRTPFLDPVGAALADTPAARAFSWILAAPAATVLRRAKT
jgi:hypothetical protein